MGACRARTTSSSWAGNARRPPNPRSFEDLFLDLHDRLYRALYFITGSRGDAEELMQDAFLKLWERWDRIRYRGSGRVPVPGGAERFRMRVRRAGWRLEGSCRSPRSGLLRSTISSSRRTSASYCSRHPAPAASCARPHRDSSTTARSRPPGTWASGRAPCVCSRRKGERHSGRPKETRMPDVKQVYDMVTKQKPPEPGALERQHQASADAGAGKEDRSVRRRGGRSVWRRSRWSWEHAAEEIAGYASRRSDRGEPGGHGSSAGCRQEFPRSVWRLRRRADEDLSGRQRRHLWSHHVGGARVWMERWRSCSCSPPCSKPRATSRCVHSCRASSHLGHLLRTSSLLVRFPHPRVLRDGT